MFPKRITIMATIENRIPARGSPAGLNLPIAMNQISIPPIKLHVMKRLLLVSTIVLLSQIALAQKAKLSGSVINKSTQLPLSGATVTTNGNAVKTDDKGQFSIEAQTGDDLSVSYVGMKTVTIKIKNGAPLSIELEEGSSQLEQVVVVGYNTQRKVDLTGAVSVVRPDDVKNVPASNLVTALQGSV